MEFTIYIPTTPYSGYSKGYGIIQNDRTFAENPENDFFIQFPLMRNEKILDYVNIEIDQGIEQIERQEINPFFFEFGFFDNIEAIHINKGSDITPAVADFIRSARIEISNLNLQEVRVWFDSQGKNELPWNLPNGETVTIDDLDRVQLNLVNVTSKADFLNINIAK